MQRDAQGLAISAASAPTAAAFDAAVAGYLGLSRRHRPTRMEACLAADPAFGLAHCLKGYLLMLTYKQANVAVAAASAAAARRCMADGATARELRHLDALDAWIAGDVEAAIAIWEAISGRASARRRCLPPGAFRLFLAGAAGRHAGLGAAHRAALERRLPGHDAVLGSLCFAHEECGHYTEAEAAGRAAIAPIRPISGRRTAWRMCMEMQGRRAEGMAWIDGLHGSWEGANNLRHHLWWHAAMYHLELGDIAAVLALYDSEFRDLASPLTEGACPICTSMCRTPPRCCSGSALHGVDVGDRWEELADKAEARIGDCLSAFTLPHWMMALAATGRDAAAGRMLAAMRDLAQAPGPRRRWSAPSRCR